jgi:ubiquinone/menaquinone biosynthesis C-methylase UbiE
MNVAGKLTEILPNISSTLPENERESSYDKIAGGYDALVGNGIYNRLIWGCSKSEYTRSAKVFFGQVPTGPIIDFGCGTCVFTASGYKGLENRLTLFDRSLGMLKRAKKRLPRSSFIQGDALNAPFADGSFSGAMGWGMSHVFGTQASYFSEMHRLLQPGGVAAISSLILTDRKIGNKVLNMLEKQGEAIPETGQQVAAAFAQFFDVSEQRVVGSMLFLTGRKQII